MSPALGTPDWPAAGGKERRAVMAAAAEIEAIKRMVMFFKLPVLSQRTPGDTECQAKLPFGGAFVHPRVNSADAAQIGAGTGDLRKILLVRGEIDTARGLLRRYSLRAQVGHLFGHVGEVALKRRDQAFIAKRSAMSGQDQREVQVLERAQRRDPFVEERIAHIGEPALHQIASADDPLVRQEHYGVAAGVAATEEKELNFPGAFVYDHLRRVRDVRRRRLDLLELTQRGLRRGQVLLERGLLLRVLFRG